MKAKDAIEFLKNIPQETEVTIKIGGGKEYEEPRVDNGLVNAAVAGMAAASIIGSVG